MIWIATGILGRYGRRLAFVAAIGVAGVLYGLVEQSTRPELAAWYWPIAAAIGGFVITRLVIGRIIYRLVGELHRHLR